MSYPAVYPTEGGSEDTWGDELRDFAGIIQNLATGNLTVVCYENETVCYENEVVTIAVYD